MKYADAPINQVHKSGLEVTFYAQLVRTRQLQLALLHALSVYFAEAPALSLPCACVLALLQDLFLCTARAPSRVHA